MAVFYKYEYRKKWKNIHPCPNVFGPPGTLLALLNFKDRGFRCYKHLYDNPASHLSHRKASLRKYATGHGASLADIAALSKSKPSWSCCYCCSYETMASNITKIILAPHLFRGRAQRPACRPRTRSPWSRSWSPPGNFSNKPLRKSEESWMKTAGCISVVTTFVNWHHMNEVKVITTVLLGMVQGLWGCWKTFGARWFFIHDMRYWSGGFAVLDLHFQCGNVMKVDR